IVELFSGELTYRVLGAEEICRIDYTGGGHGDGDEHIMAELFESMSNGSEPVCSGKEGLLSAVVGISIDQARREGRIVDLRSVWENLGVAVS
ncbi:MAG: hypothetical protein AAF975_04010, partial [Spirochaetota bacterium]